MSTMNIFDLTDTWNAGATTFTAIKMNATDTASAAGSALLDLQVGGVSQFKVSKAGALTAVGVAVPTISSTSTLTNKTLSSPTLSGTVAGDATFSGTIYFANNTSIGVSSFGTFYNKTLALGGGASSSVKFTTTNTGTANSDGTDIGVLNASTSDFFIVQRETANILIEVNGGERARISPDGNVGIGTSSFGASSQKVLAIGNAAAVPTGNPTDGGVLYVESGALKYRGSSGTVTTIANA
jgi:hypothetical protein